MINCIMGNGFLKEFDTSLSNPQSACEAAFSHFVKTYVGVLPRILIVFKHWLSSFKMHTVVPVLN